VDGLSRLAAVLAAAVAVACGLGLAVTASLPRPSAPLPDQGEPAIPAAPGRSASPVVTPSPDDRQAAVPDVDPGRTVSPAQGPVRLAVRGGRPAGPAAAAYRAYLGWLRAYLDAYARPGQRDRLGRYATPAAARAVRAQAAVLATRGWAEYGSAVLVSATTQVTGSTGTVRACLDLSGLATRDTAGRLAGRDRPVRSAATLTAGPSGWRVSRDDKEAVTRC
jgi:hypothetical protein